MFFQKYKLSGHGFSKERVLELATKFKAWADKDTSIWFGDFAIECGFHRQRLDELAKEHIEFADAYAYARARQESRILKLSLSKKADSNTALMVLKNFHENWRDKTTLEVEQAEKNKLVVIRADKKEENSIENKVEDAQLMLTRDNADGKQQ